MKILFSIVFFFILFVSVIKVQAATVDCTVTTNQDKVECKFGQITPPSPIAGLIGKDETGATGIGKFLSNFIKLIYVVAIVVLIFMLLWGAFDWMVSEGNKEKLAAAQNKIMSAIIGILLFAVAFAIIAVLGQFTGFPFFAGQNPTTPNKITLPCPSGKNCTIL